MTYIQYPNYTSIPQWTNKSWELRPIITPVTNIASVVEQKINAADSFKPKRAGKNGAHIVFVLDDSVSMKNHSKNTISGFNEYLKAQKLDAETTGIETFVSLYKFDGSSLNRVYTSVNIKDAAELNEKTYTPSGYSTNLTDAIGGVMLLINSDLSKLKKDKRTSVIITVLTDGAENSSRTFVNTDIKTMIEKSEEKNWGFIFLGATPDTFSSAASYGFNKSSTLQYSTRNISEGIATASRVTASMKSAYANGLNTTLAYASSAITDEERAISGGKTDV